MDMVLHHAIHSYPNHQHSWPSTAPATPQIQKAHLAKAFSSQAKSGLALSLRTALTGLTLSPCGLAVPMEVPMHVP